MDDILYIVKSELRKADAAATDQILNELLGERPPEASRQEALILDLDPYLKDQILFCSYISTDSKTDVLPDILDRRYRILTGNSGEILAQMLPDNMTLQNISFTWLQYGRGLYFILTATDPSAFDPGFPKQLLRRFFPLQNLPEDGGQEAPEESLTDICRIGISSSQVSLPSARIVLQEALSANISCVLDRYSMLSFNETGLDRLLCNVCLLRETASLCMDLDQKIESAVGVNGSAEDLRLCPSSLRTP